MRSAVISLLLLCSPAAKAAEQFDCGGARAAFHFVPAAGDHPGAGRATLEVRRGDAGRTFDLNGDFVGGLCVANDDAQPLIVYQAYCGGSGCRDYDNWGVIDPRTLAPLLVPDDGNRAAARRIIGGRFPDHIPIAEMMAVQEKLATGR